MRKLDQRASIVANDLSGVKQSYDLTGEIGFPAIQFKF